MASSSPGRLYVVATPIGNLGDISQRALEVLASVEVIYAEDTRVSRKLLDRYQITKPLRSYREAASPAQVARMIGEIAGQLERGSSLAYLSDAGTPGISDPGSLLVSRLAERGLAVVPIPGPSALTALLSVAGLPAQRPLFVGFLPKKKGHQSLIAKLRQGLEEGICDTLVLYESPERILKLLQELVEWKLPLRLCLGRELTKLHEEILRGSPEAILEVLAARPSIRGEIVLAISLRT